MSNNNHFITIPIENNTLEEQKDLNLIKKYIRENLTQPQFRIYILYPDETIKTEIPQTDIQLGGSYDETYQNGQRRSLSFTLYNEEGNYTPDIDTLWVGTRLRLDMGLQIGGDNTYWFQKGIFVIQSVTPSYSNSKKVVKISAGDKFSLFENATGVLPSTYEIPSGTDIESLIKDILMNNNGNSEVLDPKDYILHENFKGKKTQVEISLNAGDKYSTILLNIATQLSAEIYYNEKGNLVLIPTSESTMDKNKPLLFEYQKEDLSDLSFGFSYNNIVNRVIVVGTTSSGGTFSAEAVNDDPRSPLCYQRIGYHTGSIINDSNIYSMYLAQERAEYELRQQLILKTSTSASVLFNPLLEVNNLISISEDFFNLTNERFLIQSISCSLDYSNQMSISFSNLDNLPFTAE